MGNDGFACGASSSPASIQEVPGDCSAPIPSLTREEYAFVKSHVTLMREVGFAANRGGKFTYGGDLVDGVGLQGVTSNSGS